MLVAKNFTHGIFLPIFVFEDGPLHKTITICGIIFDGCRRITESAKNMPSPQLSRQATAYFISRVTAKMHTRDSHSHAHLA
jgi:hypothetical protein